MPRNGSLGSPLICKEYISSYRKSLQKWLRELYNINMTNEDKHNNDTKYINNAQGHKPRHAQAARVSTCDIERAV